MLTTGPDADEGREADEPRAADEGHEPGGLCSTDDLAAAAATNLSELWRLAVGAVCAAHRSGAIAAGEAADGGRDDAFGALAALCRVLLDWLTWCSRLPFAAPDTLPDDESTLAYDYAIRSGDPGRLAVVALTEVIAARRWPPARRGRGEGGHALGR